MFANLQIVRKKFENIDLKIFWSTDTTNVTGIKQLVGSKKRIILKH